MLRNIIPIVIATLYLIIYIVFINNPHTIRYGYFMFIFSPFIVAGMVYAVLKYGKYDGPALGDDEFGYQDRPKASTKVISSD